MAADLPHPDAVEHVAEADVFGSQPSLQRADVQPKAVGDCADRCAAGRHQQQDGLLDLFDHAPLARVDHGFDQFAGMQRQRRLGPWIGPVEVRAPDQDAVELRAEFDRAGKQPLIHVPLLTAAEAHSRS